MFPKPRFISSHVGGTVKPVKNNNYLQTQSKLIDISKEKDPEKDFGKRNFNYHYINIDSSFRKTQPESILENRIRLIKDPLDFNIGSNKIFINHKNNKFVNGNLVSVSGIIGNRITLRTRDNNNNASFEIPVNCNFIKIFVKHNIPLDYTGDDILVTLSGIKGDTGNPSAVSYLGNIPINLINTQLIAKLTLTANDLLPNSVLPTQAGYFDISPDYFFVVISKSQSNASINITEYNYSVLFQSIGGIPLSFLNASYPISIDVRQPFHKIFDVSSSGYCIETSISASIDINAGGSNVIIQKVKKAISGFPNPNNYMIDLDKTYNNIISARLVSLEFPNTQDTIIESGDQQNNKIYWNNLDDGNFLYSITVPQGNYSPEQLKSSMEELFLNTQRINVGFGSSNGSYSPGHFMQVNINQTTNIVSFKSYKEYNVASPITTVIPLINTIPQQNENFSNTKFIITIQLIDHGMINAGSLILIEGMIEHLSIPASILNREHVVKDIISDDEFTIELPIINLSQGTRTNSGGGNAVTIYIPDTFRMRFDFQDTLGNVLGFRNPGDKNSVTGYDIEHTNKEKYAFEISKNSRGEDIILTNNTLQLAGNNYVIMKADPLRSINNIGSIKNAFAKIKLCDLPGSILYNSYVNTPIYYNDPINKIDKLDIKYYTPKGDLYDFNGAEHSFTLELVTLKDLPSGTNIDLKNKIRMIK